MKKRPLTYEIKNLGLILAPSLRTNNFCISMAIISMLSAVTAVSDSIITRRSAKEMKYAVSAQSYMILGNVIKVQKAINV